MDNGAHYELQDSRAEPNQPQSDSSSTLSDNEESNIMTPSSEMAEHYFHSSSHSKREDVELKAEQRLAYLEEEHAKTAERLANLEKNAVHRSEHTSVHIKSRDFHGFMSKAARERLRRSLNESQPEHYSHTLLSPVPARRGCLSWTDRVTVSSEPLYLPLHQGSTERNDPARAAPSELMDANLTHLMDVNHDLRKELDTQKEATRQLTITVNALRETPTHAITLIGTAADAEGLNKRFANFHAQQEELHSSRKVKLATLHDEITHLRTAMASKTDLATKSEFQSEQIAQQASVIQTLRSELAALREDHVRSNIEAVAEAAAWRSDNMQSKAELVTLRQEAAIAFPKLDLLTQNAQLVSTALAAQQAHVRALDTIVNCQLKFLRATGEETTSKLNSLEAKAVLDQGILREKLEVERNEFLENVKTNDERITKELAGMHNKIRGQSTGLRSSIEHVNATANNIDSRLTLECNKLRKSIDADRKLEIAEQCGDLQVELSELRARVEDTSEALHEAKTSITLRCTELRTEMIDRHDEITKHRGGSDERSNEGDRTLLSELEARIDDIDNQSAEKLEAVQTVQATVANALQKTSKTNVRLDALISTVASNNRAFTQFRSDICDEITSLREYIEKLRQDIVNLYKN